MLYLNEHRFIQKTYEDYRNGYLFSQPSPTRDLFLRACNDEAVPVQQLYKLLTKRNDYGGEPFVVNIEEATTENNNYRTALWIGDYFQVTLMSLHLEEDIGLKMHPDVDQFLRIDQGQGILQMGDQQDQLNFEEEVFDDFAIVIPAGKWHNLTNTGDVKKTSDIKGRLSFSIFSIELFHLKSIIPPMSRFLFPIHLNAYSQ
jgi:mannose-6-phosphate isomerase-like protein (cupin superfamily)